MLEQLSSPHSRPSTMCSSFITTNSASSLAAVPSSHWVYPLPTAATPSEAQVQLSSTIAPNHPTLGGTAMLQCYVCSKTFNRIYSLDRHMMIHTGERPFPCKYCPYKANQKIVLQKHISRIHGIHRISDKDETCSDSIVTATQTFP